MAAGDLIRSRGTETVLEASGASTADTVFTQANDANVTTAVMDNKPQIQFQMETIDFTVNPAVGAVINIYARPINIVGASDAQIPSANFRHYFVTAVKVDDDQAVTQYVKSPVVDWPFEDEECEIYIENRTGQTLSVGWDLKYQPVTLKVE